MRRLLVAMIALALPTMAVAQQCSAPLVSATRLVLVVAPSWSSTTAELRRYERATPGEPWRQVGGPVHALIGKKGTAWSHAFSAYAQKGEPVKVDGDKRAPAGIYDIGRPFGFSPSQRANYLHIENGTVCVDDPASPAYNTITTRSVVGARVHGENMWRVPDYKHGLVVNYPTDARARAGSCIFIHIALPGKTGTAGCVAVAEPEVISLQDFSQGGAVLAILPKQALERFKGCLPQL